MYHPTQRLIVIPASVGIAHRAVRLTPSLIWNDDKASPAGLGWKPVWNSQAVPQRMLSGKNVQAKA